jgi:hypothetical protein
MDNKRISSTIDKLDDANKLLEICRGYAQSNVPDMKALSEVLYMLKLKYEVVAMELTTIYKA